MKQFNKIISVGLGFGVLAVVLCSIPSLRSAAADDIKTVIIRNTPLPVSGTVGVSGIPNPLPVSGTVSANVTFPTSFAVTESGTPFATTLCYPSGGCPTTYQVPAANRLIIEFTSGQCSLSGSTGLSSAYVDGPDLDATTGGVIVVNSVAPFFTVQSISGNTVASVSWAQQTKIYADPSSTVYFNMFGSGASQGGNVSCQETISGRLTTP